MFVCIFCLLEGNDMTCCAVDSPELQLELLKEASPACVGNSTRCDQMAGIESADARRPN